MQRTVTPSGKPYIGSNPIPSTIKLDHKNKYLNYFDPLKNTPKKYIITELHKLTYETKSILVWKNVLLTYQSSANQITKKPVVSY